MNTGPIKTACLTGALLTALVGCDSTHIGNPPSDPGDPVVARATLDFAAFDEESPGGLTVAGGHTVDGAWIVLRDVALTPAGACTDDEEAPDEGATIDLEGPIVVDLLSGRSYPSTPMFERPAASFCKMKFKLHASASAELPPQAPPGLIGRTVLVEGHRGDGVPFVVEGEFPDTIVLHDKDGELRLIEGDQRLFLSFAIDTWFDRVALDQLGDEQAIVINQQTQPILLNDFRQAFQSSSRLFRDQDEDGALEPASDVLMAVGGQDSQGRGADNPGQGNDPPGQPGGAPQP